MRVLGTKLIQLVVVLLVVSFFSFLLINLLPGDPA
jgi:ABC-type dipeptide/oligopeptide/nickel transport system permease component